MNSSLERRSVAGIDLTVAEPGTAGAETETLFCLHGIGGDDASFLPQSSALSEQFRVVAWNMPGYRQSQRLADFSFANLSSVLEQVLDELGVGTVHLLGQSIGGMIAQEFVHRHPERVKSLVLIATTSAFGGRDESFKESFLAARLKPLDEGMSMAELAVASIPAIVGKNTSKDVVRAAEESMAGVDSDVYRDVLRCLVTFNRRIEWPEIQCPVCLLAGEEDTNSPAATMEKMSTKLPNAEFHTLKGAGHLVNLELGNESNRIIANFLNKL